MKRKDFIKCLGLGSMGLMVPVKSKAKKCYESPVITDRITVWSKDSVDSINERTMWLMKEFKMDVKDAIKMNKQITELEIDMSKRNKLPIEFVAYDEKRYNG